MMQSKKVGTLMVVVLLVSMVVAACAPAAAPQPPAAVEAPAAEAPAAEQITDTELNLLCTPQEQWCQGMKQEFEAKYGITVNYVRMSSGEAVARLVAEKTIPPSISGGVVRSTALSLLRKRVCWNLTLPRTSPISLTRPR
jgi:ABC-type glycerol-3-phosphate transport system substrate-binding protein